MTSKNNKRFANRETVVKGFVIDLANQTQTPFEVKTAYTRSNDKAVAFARKAMQIDDNPQIIVAVTEIQNEAPKPIKYNESKIMDYCIAKFDDEEKAKKELAIAYDENDYSIKSVRWFEYECAFWAYDKIDDNYITDYCHDESPIGFTKVDMRSFMANSAHELTGYEILAIHNCTKKEVTRYCLIENNELDKCIES